MSRLLTVSSSPHLRHPDTTSGIMLDVIIALIPAALFGCVMFGWHAAAVLFVCMAAAVLSEYVWNLCLRREQSIGDLSALVTGLLLGMNLPPEIPLWIAAIGSVVAIIVVKQMFGGLGHNFANPAITARIVLLVSFPSHMTRFTDPFSDAVTSATPLADSGAYSLKELFFGAHGGTIGETAAFLLIIGGLYLLMRRIINPIIPVAFMGTVALTALIAGTGPLEWVLSGGVVLGAIFMATDYVTSPTTNLGKLVFGVGCGLLTFVIRRFAALPEGVSYAILLMNILTPHINRFTARRPFGTKLPKKEAAEQ